jgi:putative flavoprotein involved in K+ transport
MQWDCIVIGAGQSGLSAGYYLKQTGLKFTLLDRHHQPGGSWQDYFKSLTLFSPARYAALPGMDFPGDPDHYPARDEVIAYLRRYADQFNVPVIPATVVQRVERSTEGFRLHTNNDSYATKTLIAGTGPFNTPYYPAIPGSEKFRGRILHAYNYEDTTPYASQRIVVVGARESAIQIAVELAQVACVTLATRRPLQFIPQRILGLDIHFFLHATRYDTLPLGLWTELKGRNVL